MKKIATISSPSQESELENKEEKNRYDLYIPESVLTDLKNLSRRYFKTENKFVTYLLERKFDTIHEDITKEDYILVEYYLELRESPEIINRVSKKDELKLQKFPVELSNPHTEAIETWCKLIHWDFTRFIEYAIETELEELMYFIDVEELGFIRDLFDFSTVLSAIERIISIEEDVDNG